jgi:hypothetical protein
MKKLNLVLVAITLLVSVQGFSQFNALSEYNFGIYRNARWQNDHFGTIGEWAVDFSLSGDGHESDGATGKWSFTSGFNTAAHGYASVAIGERAFALGNNSNAFGFESRAKNAYSAVNGIYTTADTNACLAIGVNNTVTTNGTEGPNYYNYYNNEKGAFGMTAASRAFVIGNGSLITDGQNITGAGTKSDAFTVYFDGTTVIAGDLTVNSDQRLKSNIVSLGSTLSKLMQLDGKSYNMNGDDSKKKIGLLAQNVQEVFPELVKTGTDALGTLSVNFIGLIHILINSIKELQAEVLELKSKK